MSALPVHAWVYGMHKTGATPEEYAERGAVGNFTRTSWRMACGATFCGVEENFRVFGPKRLSLFWPLKRAEVTCKACRAVVDPLVRSVKSDYLLRLGPRIVNLVAREEARRAAARAKARAAAEAERLLRFVTGECPACGGAVTRGPGPGRPRLFCFDCTGTTKTQRGDL
jgi:hypothetical protein